MIEGQEAARSIKGWKRAYKGIVIPNTELLVFDLSPKDKVQKAVDIMGRGLATINEGAPDSMRPIVARVLLNNNGKETAFGLYETDATDPGSIQRLANDLEIMQNAITLDQLSRIERALAHLDNTLRFLPIEVTQRRWFLRG